MNTEDYMTALAESFRQDDVTRVAATGPMSWTLDGVGYNTEGQFSWDTRLAGWLIKGTVGVPFTPEYQLVFISVGANDPYETIDKHLNQGDDGLVFTYSQTQSGGIWIQQPPGSVRIEVDLARKVLTGSFEAQVKVGTNPARVPLSGRFSLAP